MYNYVLALLLIVNVVECQHYVQCEDIAFGQFVASNKSCQHYIYCDQDSYEGECDDNLYFDATKILCVEKDKANCTDEQNGLNNNNTSTPTPISTTTTLTATTILATTLAHTDNNLTTANALNNSTILDGINATNVNDTNILEIISPLATIIPDGITSETISGNNNHNQHESKIIVANACPSKDNVMEMVLLPHLEICSQYFVCYEGQPIAMQCASLLQFNAQTGKCDYVQNVKCQAQNAVAQCATRANEMIAHPSNCNYYYECRNGFLLMRQCPMEQGWDYAKRSCVRIHDAKCMQHA